MCYYSGMKEFKDYKPEINKCSKCGLCESVCPLFKINPNDEVTLLKIGNIFTVRLDSLVK